MNTKTKNNLYIVIVAVIIAIFSYIYLLGMVRARQTDELGTAISKLQEMELIQENFSNNERLLKETQKERELLNSFIVEKSTIAAFIEKLELIAKHSNVEITKTLSVEKNPQKPKDSLVKFNMRANGNFKDVYYFALLIESLPYKIRIKKMAIATSDASLSSVSSGVVAVPGTKVSATSKGGAWVADINFELLGYINE